MYCRDNDTCILSVKNNMKQPKAMIVDSSIPCSELAKERLSEM